MGWKLKIRLRKVNPKVRCEKRPGAAMHHRVSGLVQHEVDILKDPFKYVSQYA
jgi:hypothetical protein